MARAVLVLALLALGACSKPNAPDKEQPPEPRAGRMAQAANDVPA